MCNNDLIIEKTKAFVREKLQGESSGHDWEHILRVYNNAKLIAEKEGGNLFVIELAALLHDIADWKFSKDNIDIGYKVAYEWMNELGVLEGTAKEVALIIKTISFKGGTTNSNQQTIEGKIVQDADRLDAIGAIGIGRAFAYGGFKGRTMYNSEVRPRNFNDFEEYKKDKGPTINHFYEKLLLLKDLMNTDEGKILAEERHKFMEEFLIQFFKEYGDTKNMGINRD